MSERFYGGRPEPGETPILDPHEEALLEEGDRIAEQHAVVRDLLERAAVVGAAEETADLMSDPAFRRSLQQWEDGEVIRLDTEKLDGPTL